MIRQTIRVFLVLILTIVCSQSYAKETHVLNIKTQQDIIKYSFEDEPTFVLEGNGLVIKSKKAEIQDMLLEYSDISNIYVTIEDITTDVTAPMEYAISYINDQLTLWNVDLNVRITVYSVNGQQISANAIHNGNNVSLDMSELPKGLYIVKTNNRSYKFLKK